MKKCERDDCERQATHSVTLNVPAMDVPIDIHQPIKMYVGIELCRDHAKGFGEDFDWAGNEQLKDAIATTLSATGRSEADFDRAFHSVIRLDDNGYQQFLKLRGSRDSS